MLGLTDTFGDTVFSADMVTRGKPHPDIFLLAAERIVVAITATLAKTPAGQDVAVVSRGGSAHRGVAIRNGA